MKKPKRQWTRTLWLFKKSAVRVKTKFIKFCKDLELNALASAIRNSKGNSLKVFFSAKTHKADVPFRTIVSEGGAWQKNVSQFLLKSLK